MARHSDMSGLLTLGLVGAAGWWAWSNNWFGLFGVPAVPGTGATPVPVPTTGLTPATPTATPAVPAAPAPASVSLAGPVTATINNALKANVTINGTTMNLAVIPGGGAYNASGQDVSATITALGTSPAAIYALMQAAYTPPAAVTAPVVVVTKPTNTVTPQKVITPVSVQKHKGMRGMGMMAHASARNYVPRGSSYR